MRTWIYTVFTVFLLGAIAPASADDHSPEYDARLSGYSYPFEVHTFEFDS